MKTNCQCGFTPEQERSARKIRRELLDNGSSHNESVVNIWLNFIESSNGDFFDFFKAQAPVLYSGFIRAQIPLQEPVEEFLKIQVSAAVVMKEFIFARGGSLDYGGAMNFIKYLDSRLHRQLEKAMYIGIHFTNLVFACI